MTLHTLPKGMTYLDRSVRFVEMREPIGLGDASSSTLFLGLYGLSPSQSERMRLIRTIQAANPLAILLAGEESECVFDDLLQALSVETIPRPMMTNYSAGNADEAIKIFLQATWPYEERFDEWKSCTVVSYASPIEPLRAAVERIVFGST